MISTQPHSDAVTDSVALYGCTEDEGTLAEQTDEDVYEWLTTYERESYYSDEEKSMLYRELGGNESAIEERGN